MSWFFLVNQTHTAKRVKTIPEQMSLMSCSFVWITNKWTPIPELIGLLRWFF